MVVSSMSLCTIGVIFGSRGQHASHQAIFPCASCNCIHQCCFTGSPRSYKRCLSRRSRRFTVFAATKGSAKSKEPDEKIPSWAKPGSDEPPPWARDEGTAADLKEGFEVPFIAYLLASAVTAIAAIGSIFEYVNQKPVFGVVNSDSIFYAPILGFFAFTGIPTSAFLWFKSVQTANKEAEEQDRRDGYKHQEQTLKAVKYQFCNTMEEQPSKDVSRKRIAQQISVPFLWEEKPGMPKKEWTPNSPLYTAAFPPVLLLLLPPPPQPSPRLLTITPSSAKPPIPPIASVHENFANSPPPGAPLPSIPPPPISSMLEMFPTSTQAGILLPSRPPPPPPVKLVVSVPFKWEEKPGTPLQPFTRRKSLAPKSDKSLALPPAYAHLLDYFESDEESTFDDDDDDDEPDWLRELDSSQLMKQHADMLMWEVPSSPESESGSSTSSYATGSTSPVGSSFLEQLFPLYTPKPNSPRNLVAHSKRGLEANAKQLKALRSRGERSIAIRRPQTLGELIMLSRRRSYMQKDVLLRKMSVSKEFEEPSDFGCCMFGAGNGGIAKLLRGKSLLTLKFA